MSGVGIFSGAFDPVHHGHIHFALVAYEQLGLDKVIFLPELHSWHKKDLTDIRHREQMLKLAIESFSDVLKIGKISSEKYNLNTTLDEINRKYAPSSFLLGSDVFLKMNPKQWPGLDRLTQNYELIVGLRDDDDDAEIERHALSINARVNLIKTNQPLQKSTTIRQKSAAMNDKELYALVDLPVASYIRTHRLYFKN